MLVADQLADVKNSVAAKISVNADKPKANGPAELREHVPVENRAAAQRDAAQTRCHAAQRRERRH